MTSQLMCLPEAECFRLLARGHFGRVGLVENGRPVVLPVNYAFDRGYVIFQSTQGSKLDGALAHRSFAYEISGRRLRPSDDPA